MLPRVTINRDSGSKSTSFDNYSELVEEDLIEEIRHLASKLNGLRVCNINATASGGGVAELLSREIPVYRALGIDADWRTIYGDKQFFKITKSFHNALQGGDFRITDEARNDYLENNRISSERMETHYDVIVVHDPQPAAIRHFVGPTKATWLWRCHVDSSSPNEQVWSFLRPYIEEYDGAIFTLDLFRPPDLQLDQVAFVAPAIDPFSAKNMDLPHDLCRRVIANSGVNLSQPVYSKCPDLTLGRIRTALSRHIVW